MGSNAARGHRPDTVVVAAVTVEVVVEVAVVVVAWEEEPNTVVVAAVTVVLVGEVVVVEVLLVIVFVMLTLSRCVWKGQVVSSVGLRVVVERSLHVPVVPRVGELVAADQAADTLRNISLPYP